MRLIPLLFAAAAWAQDPAAVPGTAETKPHLRYEGKPLALRASCDAEAISALGLSCTSEHPCPVFAELVSAEAVGSRVVIAGNMHTSTSTLESILLVSEDGGRTWSEGHQRLPASGLDQIQFFDLQYGWISGQVMLALPRDAFFLITADGGKTWRKRPVFSEPRVGNIDSFWFDSKTAGSMIIDRLQSAENGMRYEAYETTTGGDTWTLRQASDKPSGLKRRPAAGPMRVAADGKSKSYKVERQTAAGWELLAAFAVAAGECRPAEPEALAEPEPEPEPEPEAAPAKPRSRR